MRRSALCAALLLCAICPAQAITLSRNGPNATLSGPLKPGDDLLFRDFLAKGPIRTLYLQSPGGKIEPAIEIARAIRKAGIATALDGGRSYCNSACTMIFIAGASRYYFNAQGVSDGINSKNFGLGFHEGNVIGGNGRQQSGRATAEMIGMYYELGAPGAAEIVTKATFRQLYRVSPATALAKNIATSLSRP